MVRRHGPKRVRTSQSQSHPPDAQRDSRRAEVSLGTQNLAAVDMPHLRGSGTLARIQGQENVQKMSATLMTKNMLAAVPY